MIAYIVKLLKELGAVVLGLVGPLNTLKSDFNSWKTDWTSARASKIDMIENRLSNSRASKLDNLNRPLDTIETAVNTKASQTSVDAVKNFVDDLEGRLTSTRASKLDNLDTTVSSRASQTTASNILSKVNQGMVKRVQRGLVIDKERPVYSELSESYSAYDGSKVFYRDITLPYALTATSKAILTVEFGRKADGGSGSPEEYISQLVNSNTIRIMTKSASSYPPHKPLIISWQVIEYY